MMILDKALSLYTDLLNEDKFIDIDYFKINLSNKDYIEFLELIEIINLTKSIKKTNDFEKKFSLIDDYKQSIYHIPQASNFRVCEDIEEQDILDKLDKIFEEEFGDE